MTKPFNVHYAKGGDPSVVKQCLQYKPYLKKDDEIEGIRTDPDKKEVTEPVLLSIEETRPEEIEELNKLSIQ